MKTGIYIAVALLAGALLTTVLLSDPGYVALRFGSTLIEMSAVSFVLELVAAYFLLRLAGKLIRARRLWRESQQERRFQKARRSLARGLMEIAEGEWRAAEDTLSRSARDAEQPAAH